ncbi:WD40 repeat-like protein [Dacryopinax primogenitus]|uniref:WD40 repeat-like protein n=1 Tax=Dacryopinax primogenitus (strain DJM 731) TaxID=1858805 RepID=M5FT13_DACPD|nr:WD40 repeat-like protein [Dacryopinax primogenitus]EJT99123.1 WD40 repeat-like protein [Dacryopinax primogenitus]
MTPFAAGRSDSTRILKDLAPVIMTPRMIKGVASASSTISSRHLAPRASDFAALGRAPLRLTLHPRRITSADMQILEATPELLHADVPEPRGVEKDVSLLRGFQATIPSSERGKVRRRKVRMSEGRVGLAGRGAGERGLLTEENDEGERPRGTPRKGRNQRRKEREAGRVLSREELSTQVGEIRIDKENLHVRRALVNADIDEITQKIAALDAIREQLHQDLLRMQEEELELDDELTGVQEQLAEADSRKPEVPSAAARRKKGPAFLPSDHDDLPPGVAFMTLSHSSPITSLDFSEPYGTLVSADRSGSVRVWDLLEGEEIGRLRGHAGCVKALQVEGDVCISGGEDGAIRVWSLGRVEEAEAALEERTEKLNGHAEPAASETGEQTEQTGPLLHVLEGHSKAVTALYFEDTSLVTGASDKTLRQWDLTTGQCILTMDILWAISHPPVSPTIDGLSPSGLLAAASGSFSWPIPSTGEMWTDYVGGVQAWGYALVSGSGDGAVRLWDMRTGQPHRTLLGHTAPVTCVQFDELNILSGGLDKTVRIWDLRMGNTVDIISFDGPVTSLQFDSRKVVACAGENGVKIWNRTSRQMSTLSINGHTLPATKIRYIDRYMVSGGADGVVKTWAL